MIMDPSWAGRRCVVRWSLVSCLGLSIYSIYSGPTMAQAVIPYVSGLAGMIIGSYVFGAAWERTSGISSQNKEKG